MRRLLLIVLGCGLVWASCSSEASNTAGTASPVSPSVLPSSPSVTTTELSTSTTERRDDADDICAGLSLGPAVPVVGGESWPEISGAVLAADDGSGPSVWAHQDSGHPAELVRIGFDGTILDTVVIDGLEPVDWEDIAAAEDAQGRRHLFVADIGDNRAIRPHVALHRLIEPAFGESRARANVIELVLPDGSRDAEALVVDPDSGAVIVLTKSVSGMAEVLVGDAAAWVADGTRIELALAGTLSLGLGQAVLAADLSPDGSVLGLRTPSRVLLWQRVSGRTVASVLLDETPCQAPSTFDIFGEALALTDTGYVLLGESVAPALRIAGPDGG